MNTRFKPGEIYVLREVFGSLVFSLCVTDHPPASDEHFSGIVIYVADDLCGHTVGQHDDNWSTNAPFELVNAEALIKINNILKGHK